LLFYIVQASPGLCKKAKMKEKRVLRAIYCTFMYGPRSRRPEARLTPISPRKLKSSPSILPSFEMGRDHVMIFDTSIRPEVCSAEAWIWLIQSAGSRAG